MKPVVEYKVCVCVHKGDITVLECSKNGCRGLTVWLNMEQDEREINWFTSELGVRTKEESDC